MASATKQVRCSYTAFLSPRVLVLKHVCFAAVKQAGGEVLPGACGLRLHGWRIESRKAPISSACLRLVMHLVCRRGVRVG